MTVEEQEQEQQPKRLPRIVRLFVWPPTLLAYVRLRKERSLRCHMLRRVTRLESMRDLHDKIRDIDFQIANL